MSFFRIYFLNILPLPMQAKILGSVIFFTLLKALLIGNVYITFLGNVLVDFLDDFLDSFFLMFFISTFLISGYCALSWPSLRSLEVEGGTTKKLSVATMAGISKMCPIIIWHFCPLNLQKSYSNT